MAERYQDQVERDAAFASKFIGGATNLAQRQRYQASIDEAQGLEAERDAVARERELISNPGARAMFFGRRKEEQAAQRLGMDRERLSQGERRAAFQEDLAIRKMELDEVKNERAQLKADMDSRNAIRITRDSMAAELAAQDLLESGHRPGSETFAKGVFDTIARHPFMEKSVRDSLLATAKIEDEPDTIEAITADLTPEQMKRARLTRGQKGWTVSVNPEPEPKDELSGLRKELDSVVRLRANLTNDNSDERDRQFYDQEKERIRSLISQKEGGSASTSSSIPTLTDRAQFDALPAGARYYRDGKLFQKPATGGQ